MRVHKLLCVVHGCFTAALGNAYMSLFFSGGQDAGSLQKARSSYTNAVSGGCPAAPDCPPASEDCFFHCRRRTVERTTAQICTTTKQL